MVVLDVKRNSVSKLPKYVVKFNYFSLLFGLAFYMNQLVFVVDRNNLM